MGDFFLGAGAVVLAFSVGFAPTAGHLAILWARKHRPAEITTGKAQIFYAIAAFLWPLVAWSVMRDLIDELEVVDGR